MMYLLGILIGGLALLAPAPTAATSQPVLEKPGFIKGVVVGENGQPVFGIQVRLAHVAKKHKHAAANVRAIRHRGLGSTSTLRDGSFIFSGVQPGEYRVVAGNKTIGRGHADVTVTSGGTFTVQIRLEPVVPRLK
ncbi:MAG TPA: carboxypeptidase-like regulatory domain-containing protein [Tepidisphaeraceae bacterium]|nr:carboxypeptidase-like regulatory domain-containing protein [Tepidisphaeraceae bacterium]